MLQRMNVRVDQAEDGVDCLRIIRRAMSGADAHQYDVIFMDDSMPNMMGVDATAALRELGLTVPVFGVTGNALLSDQARFLCAGATKVLLKPVSKSSVAEAGQRSEAAQMQLAQVERLDRMRSAVYV